MFDPLALRDDIDQSIGAAAAHGKGLMAPGSAHGAPLRPRDGTRTGRQGVATLDSVDERKLADADQDPRHARLNQRLRQAFIEGAEEDSRRRLGRSLTADELERVLRHFPGDIGTRSPFRELPEQR